VRTWLLVVSCSFLGCEPKLVVGERTDAGAGAAGAADVGGSAGAIDAGGSAGAIDAGGAAGALEVAGAAGAQCPDNGNRPGETDPIVVPWATGFENGFCDFESAGGFCVGDGILTTVTSPTPPGGQFAAEFSVSTANSVGNQARCVRQGTLPKEAYYGAWYYIPVSATLGDPVNSLWNLFHFQGGDVSQKGLWDVSLVNGNNGDLELLVFDFLKGAVRTQTKPIPIPIGSWFHIQFYLRRASDATGAIALYQDRTAIIEADNIVTDNSSWGQWYVGNIGKELTPPDSTLYVDDVTIGTSL